MTTCKAKIWDEIERKVIRGIPLTVEEARKTFGLMEKLRFDVRCRHYDIELAKNPPAVVLSCPPSPIRDAINHNDYVWVYLTLEGFTVLKKHRDQFAFDTPCESLHTFQLWELMQIFGPETYMGGGFFEGGTIYFSDPSK